MKKISFKNLLLLTSVCLTASCVSSLYQPTNLSEALGYTEQTADLWTADNYWWTAYQDKQLDRLVDLALKNNPDYLKTAVSINRALAELSLSTSDLFPTLNADLGASAQSAVRRTDHFSSNFSGELGLKYEVDLYGKIRDQHSAEKFEYEATLEDRQSARLSLINSVIDLYYNLTYLNNALTLTKQNIESYENIKNIMTRKYETGRTDALESLEAEQSVLTEKNRLLQLETQIAETEQTLKNLLGLSPDQKTDIVYGDLADLTPLEVNLDVPVAVLAKRPDLMAAQYRLEKSFKNLKAEEKSWYPTISVNGAVQSSSDKARTTFDFPFIGGSVGLNLPFLDWNRVRNNVKISQADYELTAIGFKDTLTQALNEVAYYDFAYRQSLKTLENIEANYKNAVQISAYYQKRYQTGKVEFRYYLEALNRENSLREDLISQKYLIVKYENYIFKALGGRYQETSNKN